jgi:hypothetical protein
LLLETLQVIEADPLVLVPMPGLTLDQLRNSGPDDDCAAQVGALPGLADLAGRCGGIGLSWRLLC